MPQTAQTPSRVPRPVTAREKRLFARIVAMESMLVERNAIASAAGKTFAGSRDVYGSLGYKPDLTIDDYFQRFRRDGIARKVVRAFPNATWRGVAGELVEDPDPAVVTPFESAWFALSERLKCWSNFRRADILSGLGEFAVVLIGAVGNDLRQPLGQLGDNGIFYLAPFSQRDVDIETYNDDVTNPRYGLPETYALSTVKPSDLNDAGRTKSKSLGADRKIVHYTRIVHIAEGLENSTIGSPRLESVWNYFDDLEKVRGAGAEASWQRANPGMQFDVDKEMGFAEGEEDAFDDEIEEYMHGQRPYFRTRGITTTAFKADVSNFDRNASEIIGHIAAGAEIPQRLLMGSERGQLASEQDRDNWAERVQDRRQEWAGPIVVRPFVDLCIDRGALPKPVQYDVSWPTQHDLSDEERAKLASILAEANRNAKKIIFTPNEIRDMSYQLEPLDESALNDAKQGQTTDPTILPIAARRKGISVKRMIWMKNGRKHSTKLIVAVA